MDQLTRHLLDKEVKEFIDSIDPSLVCKLASSLHPEKKPCQIFSDTKRGSYNICFPVEFTDHESAQRPEQWMIRIPLLPRLAFPEEKNAKYIAEKTTIPIPRIFGYTITRDNLLGLPFLALEYITGKTLHGTDVPRLSKELRSHLFGQLSEIYIQLYRQQFSQIGALTLDSNDENSTVDYAYTVLKLVFNDFYRGKDSVSGEKDAWNYLYGIFASQGIVMEWVDQAYNHGPFILMHGDLRPPNIFVDENLNIVSVIDWEWSHTVPSQMFLPPSWITGQELLNATKWPDHLAFKSDVFQFWADAREWEDRHHNPDKKISALLPLTTLWTELLLSDTVFIAYALLKPCYLGNVYWNLLDNTYYGNNPDKRVESFFELKLRRPQEKELQRVLSDLETFRKDLALVGLDPEFLEPPTPQPAKPNESDIPSKDSGPATCSRLLHHG
ncbi:predicted protein [Uncinocarpus reesii 1704]|uniref:Aminoglycoside phosphotransferase domain-containing protein n=1 Tax=Uncinocarpus reesii (strain UAMH 1704) TaxID=336963 RepID=C4JTK0_UNCRE|nr:uncharacterized protein UREG_05789 [Uncinocarpus reesii 1704]EEP80947.1 predicted protein [Uncinocarpus reesii 1704]